MNDVKVNNQELAIQQLKPTSSSSLESGVNSSSVESNRVQNSEQSKLEPTTIENVQDAVTQLNEYVQTVQRDLQFRLDDDSGKTVITVLDRESDTVVRQIPDDVALRLARDLQQDEPISLFNAKV